MGDGAPFHQIPMVGQNFVTEAGTAVDLALRIVDRFGVAVGNIPVRFAPSAAVYAATLATDSLGIAEGYLSATSLLGDQIFTADRLANSGRNEFDGRTRTPPQIGVNGVVDAASFQVPGGFAPGSYISIFGTGLSESSSVVHTPYLPLSLAGVGLSFDVPSANVHVPGRLYFVSAGQISVQVPWELAGTVSAVLKVTLGNSASRNVRADDPLLGTYQTQTFPVKIGPYSPAFFESFDSPSGKSVATALCEWTGSCRGGEAARFRRSIHRHIASGDNHGDSIGCHRRPNCIGSIQRPCAGAGWTLSGQRGAVVSWNWTSVYDSLQRRQ